MEKQHKPLPAYEGKDPFVFVCYSHADSDFVYPEIERLHHLGFNVWYDDGIAPGSEWSDAIARAIENCQVFLYLVTPNSVASEHCRREVNFAVEQERNMLAVHIEPTQVPQGLRLSLSHRQAILKYQDTPERYASRLKRALEEAASGHSDELEISNRSLRIGEAVLDIDRQRMYLRGETSVLDPKDMSVLLHLADAAPGLVSTEELLNRSWPGLVVGDNVVHQVIGRLRKMFGDSARDPRYIETMPRRGYRLLPPVSQFEPPNEVAEDLAETPEPSPKAASKHAARPSKRIKRYAVWTMGAAFALITIAFFIANSRLASVHPRSIAVLSLVDLSATKQLETLGDEIALQLNNELGRYEELRIVSNSASFAFKDSGLDIQDIGEQLNVAFVVSGTVRQSSNRVRVTLELVPVETLFQQWGNILTGDARDLLTIGQDIALQAAPQIAQSIGAEVPALRVSRTPSSKPSLQNLFKQETGSEQPTEFPAFDDLGFQSIDELGDVE